MVDRRAAPEQGPQPVGRGAAVRVEAVVPPARRPCCGPGRWARRRSRRRRAGRRLLAPLDESERLRQRRPVARSVGDAQRADGEQGRRQVGVRGLRGSPSSTARSRSPSRRRPGRRGPSRATRRAGGGGPRRATRRAPSSHPRPARASARSPRPRPCRRDRRGRSARRRSSRRRGSDPRDSRRRGAGPRRHPARRGRRRRPSGRRRQRQAVAEHAVGRRSPGAVGRLRGDQRRSAADRQASSILARRSSAGADRAQPARPAAANQRSTSRRRCRLPGAAACSLAGAEIEELTGSRWRPVPPSPARTRAWGRRPSP